MSFYRTFIAVIAMGVASAAFAGNATQTTTTTTTQSKSAKININQATATELAQVQGLNVSKAKAIVAYRKKHGDFKSVADLKDVKGFKRMDEKTLQEITTQLSVS